MAYDNLCMYCFKDLEGRSVCPHCGKDSRAAVPQIQLLPGTLVYRERFLIGRALGQDASGIVYTAMDTKRGGTIRIREYLPRNCAERLNDGGVVPIAGMEDAFEAGMNKLRASVESVEDPQKRHFFFEENGTAYIAQRKKAAAAAAYAGDDEDDDEDESRRHVFIYIGIIAAVVLAIAIGVIWFLSSMSDPEDVTLNQPLSTIAPQSTWMPEVTPTPTPYVAPTFQALVDPELSWMDYTYQGNVEEDYQQQVSSATRRPTVLDNNNTSSGGYTTISGKSSTEDIKKLQQYLVQLGWMDYTNINGKYDSATRQAVKDFQQYVNDYCAPASKLSVDGIAGKNTLKWLLNSSVSLTKPTPTPTPMVTPNPNEIRVDQNSPSVDVIAVQNKLIALGVMQSGTADGVYGNATIKAVQTFQDRVNKLQGYNVLTVSGIMDQTSMAYLNYYVSLWEQLQQATATPMPTATPTPAPTSQIINSNSSREQIAAVQEMLEKVGLLSANQVDGDYGLNTIAAMKTFQAWVNQVKAQNVLAVTGECDPLTRAYLDYAIAHNMKVQQVTATPVPTPEIIIPQETPFEEDESSGLYVDKDSEKESIAFVQEMLYSMGLLTQDDIDGDYGERTAAAVSQFQQYINQQLGEGTLPVNGWRCDDSTLGYMEYYYDDGIVIRPTQAPTEIPTQVPTAEPTQVPTMEPTAEPTQEPIPEQGVTGFEVRINGGEFVDGIVKLEKGQYLIDWAAESGAQAYNVYLYDGSGKLINKQENTTVTQYGLDTATMRANEVYSMRVAALPTGGSKDDVVWSELRLALKTIDVTQEPTEVPTAEPTQEPTAEPTPEPTAEPTQVPVTEIENFRIGVDGAETQDGVTLLEDGEYAVRWGADSGAQSYYVYLFDGNGQLMNKAEGVGTMQLDVSAADLTPGAVYTLKVGAMPFNGTQEDIEWKEIKLMRPLPPTAEPTAEPTPTPEPPRAEAIVGFGFRVNGAVEDGGMYLLESGECIIQWGADSGVESYAIYLYDGNGQLMNKAEGVDTTQLGVSASNLNPGAVYTLKVGAMPVNGAQEDIEWKEIKLMRPLPPTPEPTEVPTPTPEPTATPTPRPSVGKPAITLSSSVYQKDGVTYVSDSTIIFSWMAEGQVGAYNVTLEYQDGTKYELGTVEATSKTLHTNQLAPGFYKLHVGAIPQGLGVADAVWSDFLFAIPSPEPDPTEIPTVEPTQAPVVTPEETILEYLDVNSNPADIQKVQMKLYSYGLLNEDNATLGVLDIGTMKALAQFQTMVNEKFGAQLYENFGAELRVIDPAVDTFIDAQTLYCLLYAGIDLIG